MYKLELHLKNQKFAEKKIHAKELRFDKNEDAEKNFRRKTMYNESFVAQKALDFKMRYMNEIIKCNKEYEIYLIVESKMNEEVKEYEFFR